MYIYYASRSDAQQEQVAVHDGVSSFENILRQFQEQQQ